MPKWKVSMTVEKVVEAPNRKTAKVMLVQQMRNPAQHDLSKIFGSYEPPWSFTGDKEGTLPVLTDVSASKVK